MENKTIGIVVVVILLAVAVIFIERSKVDGNVVQEDDGFGEYRLEKIPEECRLPEGRDIESWTQHLGHHQETLYCLDYYQE